MPPPPMRFFHRPTPPPVRLEALFGRGPLAAFTILEMLVASTVLVLLLGVVFSTISQTSTVTHRAASKISSFQAARAAFDLMTENLSQATLNSYWDYADSGGSFRTTNNAANFTPHHYARRSELNFLIGNAGSDPFGGDAGTGQAVYFQAPAGVSTGYDGLGSLLNAVGYYISYGSEDALPSPFPTPSQQRYRYRLMQAIQPAENLEVYGETSGNAWVEQVKDSAVPLAENIIYMAVWPRKVPTEDPEGTELTTPPNGSDYAYDSRLNATAISQPDTANQMPPMVQITIVAMDEASAARICTAATPPDTISKALENLFETSSQTQFDEDIRTLETRLADKKINFRIFTAHIPIRESKML